MTSIGGSRQPQEYSQQVQHIKNVVNAITFEQWRKVWKTWAPRKCKTSLWLAIKGIVVGLQTVCRKEAFHVLMAVLFVIVWGNNSSIFLQL
jgi:hypothetical protein